MVPIGRKIFLDFWKTKDSIQIGGRGIPKRRKPKPALRLKTKLTCLLTNYACLETIRDRA